MQYRSRFLFLLPSLSTRFERETSMISATVFTDHLPPAITASAASVFFDPLSPMLHAGYPPPAFYGQRPLQLTYALLQPRHLRFCYYFLITVHCDRASLAHQFAPVVELVGTHTVAPRYP